MKKLFVRISAIATIGLIMASCNNEEANTKALESDNAAVQALVDAKVATLDEEVTAACEEKATAAAQLVVDSLAKVKPAVGKAVATKAKSKPAAAPAKPAEPAKPATVGNGKPSMNSNTTPGTVGNGKPSMTETPKESNTVGNGKPKM